MSIYRVRNTLPRQDQINDLNSMILELNGYFKQGTFDQNEIAQIFSDLGLDRKYLRDQSIGHTIATYSGWSHIHSEDGYSIWKFTAPGYAYDTNNIFYFDDKVLDNRGQACSESATTFDKVYLYDDESGGGTYNDHTTEAGTETGTEFELMDTTSDNLYVGDSATFAGIKFEFETRGSNYGLRVYYYNGASGDGWEELTANTNDLSDATSNFESDGRISWTVPADWTTTTVNSVSKYWVRITSSSTPVTIAEAYYIVPASSVIGLLALSSSEFLDEDWAWCSYSSSVYVTIKNEGESAYEGDAYITSSSSSTNKKNFFVYNHEYKSDYEDSTYVSGGGSLEICGLLDEDEDTGIYVEKNADEDIIRFYNGVGGVLTEQIRLEDGKLLSSTDNDIDLGDSTHEFKDIYIDGKAYLDGLGDDTLIDLGKELRFGDTAVKISSETDGHLDVVADVSLDFIIGSTEQFELVDGAIQPTTDNDVDLGASGVEFKDLYIDGTANIDSLVADTADINTGTFDGTVGGTTPGAGSFNAITMTGNIDGGNGYYLKTDEVRAYDAAGLKLYDDGGNGIFVEDGGQVGIGTASPSHLLSVYGTDDTAANPGTCGVAIKVSNAGGASSGRLAELQFGILENKPHTAISGYLVSGIANTTGDLLFSTRNATGDANLTERLRITSTGIVDLKHGQLKFPATAVPSADANTLDDYEKGTWTPVGTLVTAGNSSNASQDGVYTKIGNLVVVNGGINFTKGTGTGTFTLAGLPFANAATTVPITGSLNINAMGNANEVVQINMGSAVTVVRFYMVPLSTDASSVADNTDLGTVASIRVSISYRI